MNRFSCIGLDRDKVFQSLKYYLGNGSLVAFIGAGVSISCGYPSWRELMEELLEGFSGSESYRAYLSNCLDSGNFQELAEFIKQEDPEHYKSLLQRRFDLRPEGLSSLCRNLAATPFNSYVTTNYDLTLEQALTETGDVHAQELANSSIDWLDYSRTLDIIRESESHVYHAHGKWSQDLSLDSSLVLSESDYRQLKRIPHYQEYLRHIFSNHAVLFIGFGMHDWEIDWIDGIMSQQIDVHSDWYVLVPDVPEPIIRLRNNSASNFQWISYDSKGDTEHEPKIETFLDLIRPEENMVSYRPSESKMPFPSDVRPYVRKDNRKILDAIREIGKARAHDTIYIMDTYAEYLDQLYAPLEDAMRQGVHIQILFLEKGCVYTKGRSESLGFSGDYVDKMLSHNDSIIKRLIESRASLHRSYLQGGTSVEPGKMEYRTHSEMPLYPLICVTRKEKPGSNHFWAATGHYMKGQMNINSFYYVHDNDSVVMDLLGSFHSLWFDSAKRVEAQNPHPAPFSLVEGLSYLATSEVQDTLQARIEKMLSQLQPSGKELEEIDSRLGELNLPDDVPYHRADAFEFFNVERNDKEYDVFILYWPYSKRRNSPHHHFETEGFMYLARGEAMHRRFDDQDAAVRWISSGDDIVGLHKEVIPERKITKLKKGIIHSKQALKDNSISIHFYFPPLRKQKFLNERKGDWEVRFGELTRVS